jgi:hypothetical protein
VAYLHLLFTAIDSSSGFFEVAKDVRARFKFFHHLTGKIAEHRHGAHAPRAPEAPLRRGTLPNMSGREILFLFRAPTGNIPHDFSVMDNRSSSRYFTVPRPSKKGMSMPSSFAIKLTALSVPPLLAGGVVLWGRSIGAGLTETLRQPIEAAHFWVLVLCAVYIVSAFVAWRYAGHFGLSAGRMLLWGLIAFVCLSNALGLFTDHRSAIEGIFGQVSDVAPDLLSSLRAQLAAWSALVLMSVVAIAIGFEALED